MLKGSNATQNKDLWRSSMTSNISLAVTASIKLVTSDVITLRATDVTIAWLTASRIVCLEIEETILAGVTLAPSSVIFATTLSSNLTAFNS